MLNIDLKTEYVARIFNLEISNSFLTTFLVSLLLILFSICFYFFARKKDNIFFKLARVFVFELRNFILGVVPSKKMALEVLPLVGTFFLFIVSSNLLALFPGFLGSFFVKTAEGKVPLLRSPNSDLTTTLALALISVISIQFFSLRYLGFKRYLLRFFDFRGFINLFQGFFELLSEGTKVFSFSLRLFGNVFAGEILLLVIGFLVPYIIPVPFMFLEVFVGIIQAFIFSMLTLTFIKSSAIDKK